MFELKDHEITEVSAGYDVSELGYDIGYGIGYVLGGGAGNDFGVWLYEFTH